MPGDPEDLACLKGGTATTRSRDQERTHGKVQMVRLPVSFGLIVRSIMPAGRLLFGWNERTDDLSACLDYY